MLLRRAPPREKYPDLVSVIVDLSRFLPGRCRILSLRSHGEVDSSVVSRGRAIV